MLFVMKMWGEKHFMSWDIRFDYFWRLSFIARRYTQASIPRIKPAPRYNK
jgi:hypothetical protein